MQKLIDKCTKWKCTFASFDMYDNNYLPPKIKLRMIFYHKEEDEEFFDKYDDNYIEDGFEYFLIDSDGNDKINWTIIDITSTNIDTSRILRDFFIGHCSSW